MITILYIDDEKFDQIAFKRIVSSFPRSEVIFASDKDEAIKTFKNNSIDIIVSDVYLEQEVADWSGFDARVFYVSGLEHSFSKLSDSVNKNERCFVKPLTKTQIKRILGSVKDYTPDYNTLNEIADGDALFENELKTIFINEIPEQLKYSEEVFLENNHEELAQLVHAMQTKIRTFGLGKIESIAERIENHSRAGKDLSIIEEEFNQLKELLIKSVRVIKKGIRDEVHNH